jgi:hypothetical protein
MSFYSFDPVFSLYLPNVKIIYLINDRRMGAVHTKKQRYCD